MLAAAACTETGDRTAATAWDAVATGDQYVVYHALAPASAAPDVGSVYFTLVNQGAADTLLAASAARGRAMIHTVVHDESLTRMTHVPRLPVAAGDTVRFRPGGFHVMLTQLAEPLAIGDTVAIVLRFASGRQLTVPAAVHRYSDVVRLLEEADGAR
jgi:copper(I)-binding protein